MIIKAIVNEDKEYKLQEWNAADFGSSLTLYIQSIDLADIKETFSDIDQLDVYQDDTLLGTYKTLETYSQITYLGSRFVKGENKFADTMAVTLTKVNLADQVERLDKQINHVVDPTTLSIEELKDYKHKEVGAACEQDVFNGCEIQLSNGETELFTFKTEDQLNLKALFDIIVTNPTIESLPYHPSNGGCRVFSRADLITIYTTLLIRLTRLITYGNQLNMYIKSLENRDDLLAVTYGMELPQEYVSNIEAIMAVTITEMQKILGNVTATNNENEE